ncbi:MAG: adenylyltransferase/cytidyltransferase family protein [Butyrivibrio sp.]|nr:adenylyltransferase/cytidyltransferase family protein [Butyrivibrio sp.]
MISGDDMCNRQELVKDLPKALIAFYKFEKNKKALLVTGGLPEFEVLFSVLTEKGLKVEKADAQKIAGLAGEMITAMSVSEKAALAPKKYDYIIACGILERIENPEAFLKSAKELLSSAGKLLLATNNRLALRQLCGDKDVATGRAFDGIMGYRDIGKKGFERLKGRCYSKVELQEMLETAGFEAGTFYSVFPTISRPQILIRDGFTPNERLDVRIFPEYTDADTVFAREELLYDDFLKNGLLHQMANGYFIECSVDGGDAENGENECPDYITLQNDRGPTSLATLMYPDRVAKIPLYSEGTDRLKDICENTKYLKDHGVPVADVQITEGDSNTGCGSKKGAKTLTMPLIKGQLATDYLRDCLKQDPNRFLQELETIRDIIENSSDHVPYEEVDWTKFDPKWEKRKEDDPGKYKYRDLAFGSDEDKADIGIILKRGYIELASVNCFHNECGYEFFDQEFYEEEFPANAILLRTIEFVYGESLEMESLLPIDEVLQRFLLKRHRQLFSQKVEKALRSLRNDDELTAYNKRVRADYNLIAANRLRMNYSQSRYEQLFTDIFRDVEGKKIYLFGSGDFAGKFIEMFGDVYEVTALLDNNKSNQGSVKYGYPIEAPEVLLQETAPFKVFICIKFYEDVLEQLQNMGIKDMSIYNPVVEYVRPIRFKALADEGPKKYRVGYVAGVFDMFHIGHLNLLRRAKELCDYLIVGVVPDEKVMDEKRTMPVIPFDQRLAIVEGCRYVDEAVRIPPENPGSQYAFEKYHFDVQFSGSDYENDPEWLAIKEYLNKRGSDLVFFPYTKETSSTRIKKQLQEKNKY